MRGAPGDRGPARYVIVIDFAEADCPAAWPTMSSITSCGSPAIADYRPTDPQIAWHLARFIENVRSIPADPVIVRQNWLSAYDFVTDKGAVTLNDYARSNDPFTKVRKIQVAVEISSVIAPRQRVFASPGSSDATRTAASPRPSAGRTAILTVVVDTPRDADHLHKNPLGVFVRAVNWSKELGGCVPRRLSY